MHEYCVLLECSLLDMLYTDAAVAAGRWAGPLGLAGHDDGAFWSPEAADASRFTHPFAKNYSFDIFRKEYCLTYH